MAKADYLKSARKKLQLATVKEKVQKLRGLSPDEADSELVKLHKALSVTFGEKDAADLILEAIEENDRMIETTISSFVGSMSAEQLAALGEKS